jgi:peptidoglycan LD-endopeptidase LytH
VYRSQRFRKKSSSRWLKFILSTFVVLSLVGGYFFLRRSGNNTRALQTIQWIRNPNPHPEWKMSALQQCTGAPFLFPTDGLVGFIWGDSFRIGHQHQGIDIFAGTRPGVTPVYAAYDGYLTRLPDWKSSLIIRIPIDPLNPDRQIWTYYTHLADAGGSSYIAAAFPPGTTEIPVSAGTFLGFQGNYSGDPDQPVGVHLHFSVVLDDGSGRFRNELEISNTLDPSPYLGLPLNAASNTGEIPLCQPE